jgi:putative hydrolases of HD superfamily
MNESLQKMLEVLHLAEKLKMEMRHSWLSNGRRESVAEHTWRVSLMGMMIEPYLTEKIDSARMLKMIIIHDLVEAEATDIPAFDTMNDAELKKQKVINETKAIENLRNMLPAPLGEEIYELWMEFENKATFEAKVANALDKLEAQIQHNEADISTWLEIEHKMTFMMSKHTDFNPVLTEFKDLIEAEGSAKLKEAGIDMTKK